MSSNLVGNQKRTVKSRLCRPFWKLKRRRGEKEGKKSWHLLFIKDGQSKWPAVMSSYDFRLEK